MRALRIYQFNNFHMQHTMCMWVCVQSCLILCNPMECSPPGSSVHGDSPGENTGVGCCALLQAIFPTQGSKPRLLHYRFCTTGQPWKPHDIHQCQSHLSCCIYIPSSFFSLPQGICTVLHVGSQFFLNFLVHLQSRRILDPWMEWNLGLLQWKGRQSLNCWPARKSTSLVLIATIFSLPPCSLFCLSHPPHSLNTMS